MGWAPSLNGETRHSYVKFLWGNFLKAEILKTGGWGEDSRITLILMLLKQNVKIADGLNWLRIRLVTLFGASGTELSPPTSRELVN
jgi:hypothetical protein